MRMIFFLPLAILAQSDQADQFFPRMGGDFAASHILISYRGADRAQDDVTRSRREAKAFADQLLAQIKADPSQFEAMAREHSNGPSSQVGGNLKTFNKGDMAPDFEKALRELEAGELAPEPVRTEFGYHLIRRNPMIVKHYTAEILLVVHNEAVKLRGAKDQALYARNREEALKQIKAIETDGVDFLTLRERHSELTGTGFMGVFKAGDSLMNDQIIDALEGLAYGAITEVVDLPIGYALLRRNKVERRAASQILIRYQGAKNATPKTNRDKAAAQTLAQQLFDRVKTGEDFGDLSKEFSEDPFSVRGGRMPVWFVGYKAKPVETAITNMSVGDIELVETDEGFHILRKEALK